MFGLKQSDIDAIIKILQTFPVVEKAPISWLQG